MASTAASDVIAACATFQQNFAELEIQYGTLKAKYAAEVDRATKLKKQNDQASETVEKLESAARELREQLADALQYRDRFNNATVMVEQLRGRIETSRKDVADLIMAHQHEVEQLRAQSRDLLRRIDVCGDSSQLASVKNQQRELEERCAAINAQRLEEKERHEQLLITAHSALRDVQSRNIELEQRCRSADHEITQMKAALRRSMTLQNDAVAQEAKAQSELVHVQDESRSLKKQIAELADKVQIAERQAADDIAAAHQAAAEEKAMLVQRISSLSGKLDDAVAQQAVDVERFHTLQRTIQRKVSAARDECQCEIDSLHKEKGALHEENVRLQWRATQLESDNAQLSAAAQGSETRVASMEAQMFQLQTQLERLVQSESWTAAERDRFQAQAAMLSQQSSEFAVLRRELEEASIEREKLVAEIRFRDADLVDAKRQVDQAALHVRTVESSCQQKNEEMFRQLKEMRKHCKQSLARADGIRKKLVAALMQKEAEIASMVKASGDGTAVPAGSKTGSGLAGRSAELSGIDVLSLLKAQSADVANLQGRLSALTQQSR
jgi:chromosome segregation ATPase